MKNWIAILILWNILNTAMIITMDNYFDKVTTTIAEHIVAAHKSIFKGSQQPN